MTGAGCSGAELTQGQESRVKGKEKTKVNKKFQTDPEMSATLELLLYPIKMITYHSK